MTLTFINKSELSGTLSNVSTSYVDIVNLSRSDGYGFYVEGWLGLSNMAADDTINIQEEVWINGTAMQFEEQNISNAQDDDALHFHAKFTSDGIYHLSLKQEYGTSRSYGYHFLVLNMTT